MGERDTSGFITTRVVAIVAIAFIGGFAAHYGATTGRAWTDQGDASAIEVERQRFLPSRLTSPFLECPGTRDANLALVGVRSDLVAYLDSLRAGDPTRRVSIYLRDLTNGPWVGINERAQFRPASLFKLPVLMHTLARAEADPTFLERVVTFKGAGTERPQPLRPLPEEARLRQGEEYTYDELVRRLITNSDNDAQDLILADVSLGELQGVLALGQGELAFAEGRPVVDAKSYAALFRILYNASFLSRSSSEYALDLLTATRFTDGLRQPLPATVPVASKFGYWEEGDTRQLHECGIIYDPRGAYLLCVMTESRTGSIEDLAATLAGVSRRVWSHR